MDPFASRGKRRRRLVRCVSERSIVIEVASESVVGVSMETSSCARTRRDDEILVLTWKRGECGHRHHPSDVGDARSTSPRREGTSYIRKKCAKSSQKSTIACHPQTGMWGNAAPRENFFHRHRTWSHIFLRFVRYLCQITILCSARHHDFSQ